MQAPPTAPRLGREPLGGRSVVRGDDHPPLSHDTIDALFQRTVAAAPDAPAFVFSETGERLSWRQFADQVDRLAAALLDLGVDAGDRVGIWSPNRREWVQAQFATARIGVILVNINPAYRLSELEYALNKVSVSVLITAQAHKTSDYLGMLNTLAPELATLAPAGAATGGAPLSAAKLPHLRHVVGMGTGLPPGVKSFDALCAAARAERLAELPARAAALRCEQAINIQFTSGTTGAPKGATLTHFNVVNNGRYIAQAMRLTERDRLCIPVPLYHCFGMVLGVLACVSAGSSMVFPCEGFDPVQTLKAVSDERCTALHGVPTMFIAMLEHPSFASWDLSTLRTGIMAGAPCPIETMKRVIAQMHMSEVTIAYGMTETSPVSFQSATDDPLERRVSTVGRIQPHLDVKIVDGAGNPVPVGEKGELCTKGYSVMLGYWGDDERTREAVRDGWMHTGDLATLDEQGYCNIVGRVKDMVIRGGENVYPREVEEFLFRHPQVSAVQVFGVPDVKYGEELCAWVVAKPGEKPEPEAIRAFCRDQIAHYKIPRYVKIVDELPMTVTGKPQKFVMRDAMIRELGLVAQKTA